MYFTNTPSLNSIEAMMKRPPGSRQGGGGRNRSPYRYIKKDCDCRLCLYYRKRNGCVMKVCPVLDIRLSCKAASFREAVKAAFADVKHIPFQRRLSQIYDRKDDVPMLFQNDRHRQIFETQQISLRKPDNRTLAVLYLLTADHPLYKGFGSEGAERIDFPRADGEHGIQPVKLLELEGGKLAHMLAGNRKHRLRVAVKLLLAVGAKHHCNQAEHHALVAGGEVV